MFIKHKLSLLIVLTIRSFFGFGQVSEIVIPSYEDKYSETVRQLEKGHTDIDYTGFRNNFLLSKQFRDKKISKYDSLKKQVYVQADKSNYQEVIRLTKAMLSIDYTSLFAHKYLQQTYKILGDTTNRKKYHDIEFGLLYSITESGDGKTCETSWQVVQIEEEYFILGTLGADLERQSIDHSKRNICDKMKVKTAEGTEETYYFGVNKIFSTYPKK